MPPTLSEPLRTRAAEVLGPVAGSWCERSAAALGVLALRWDLSELVELAGGRGGAVWSARMSGVRVVVKAPFEHAESHIGALVCLGESGCGPSVLRVDEGAGVVVTEHLDGAQLGPHPTFRRLAEMVELACCLSEVPARDGLLDGAAWLRERIRGEPGDTAPGTERPTAVQRELALRALDSLGTMSRPCHGDLHPGNALVLTPGFVALIDPRGITGEPELDVAMLSRKVRGVAGAAATPDLAASLAGRAGLSPERARVWVVVLEAARL